MQCPFIRHGATTASAARRARAASAHAAPPPQREPAQWRTSALHAQAGSRSGRRSWHVGARPCTEEGRPLARAVPFHRAWSDHSRRGAARAASARVAPPPRESKRSGAQARYTRKPTHEVRAAAGTWEHGLPPKKGGLSLVQCPSIGHGATTAGARSARARQAPVLRLLPRERQRSGAEVRYMHKPAHEVGAVAGTWEHGLATEERRPLARAVPFDRAWSDHSQRGAARARGNRARCASSPERASAVAHKRATRASRLAKWTPQLARGSTALHRRRAASR